MLMNAPAILYEILQALKDFYNKGERHIIYINKLPLTEEDKHVILDVLRDGQVKIFLKSASQKVEWKETGISGVWIGVFFDRDEKPILETIEITDFPMLAMSQREDVEEAIKTLEDRIKSVIPNANLGQ
ncbi:HupH hydrogenase expression protein [Thermocrinis ruber]|uniref:HupH hydrogenase expression protein n=1 Tax=Thermocrinis ruber TaxID=75906 RepID=W0DC31_9AQUI|nr:hydrogenase expression/formation protein [Thermocrinis ruber]AHE96109.1 HupH hydrogenase expression protein [Thermocrinis ruber]